MHRTCFLLSIVVKLLCLTLPLQVPLSVAHTILKKLLYPIVNHITMDMTPFFLIIIIIKNCRNACEVHAKVYDQ